MSYVTVEGYRSHNKKLSKTLYEAARFFGEYLLGKRMDKYISIEIKLTKGMKKKEGAYGFCHIIDDNLNKPREFCIELDASVKHSFVQIVTWLAHEMVHLKQFVRKELWDYETGQVQWKKRKYSTVEYEDQPWEKEAYRLEDELYEEFAEYYYAGR
jgi:hypothetical protein